MKLRSGIWQLKSDSALLNAEPLRAVVALEPTRELSHVTWRGQPWEGALLLQAKFAERRCVESYARGNDLIANFEASDQADLSRQIYWRVSQHASRDAVAVEVILSTRTGLLDSQPRVGVDTLAAGAAAYHSTTLSASGFSRLPERKSDYRWDSSASNISLLVFRHEALGFSYAEMIHPSDFSCAALSKLANIDSWMVSSSLLPERLEKGVIRRARICGWFMPAQNDLATAVELARQFIDEPLPLTA
ncbi:MAG: hypothetical protein L0211_02540 [Planctomycetaceae bacterium]|nr:hypothetical protein [Planctomycetaceae bacterium]